MQMQSGSAVWGNMWRSEVWCWWILFRQNNLSLFTNMQSAVNVVQKCLADVNLCTDMLQFNLFCVGGWPTSPPTTSLLKPKGLCN